MIRMLREFTCCESSHVVLLIPGMCAHVCVCVCVCVCVRACMRACAHEC